ncbi:hypothetical protein BKK79_05845 [Cupriavidus sp. USMAA2-4]|uniref:RcnB family protein n=1 Tax=Cupriavidus malaysiensis TaxID=367825 RepID=A0ABN4TE59_9BURK|nr:MULTISPECIES: RcnB family protein [Cupriavidus]AOY91396.1 hypothetical protein BKK79_05845 [Cupriavidus sp. USMAA2-4]AOY99035.1 hypothetical protein BKK81_07010 [Cupriavidus sp. USMAHM13]AOZ05457.1 hypothetical protein BKK80_06310 [Cupriavidus malaysiensis]
MKKTKALLSLLLAVGVLGPGTGLAQPSGHHKAMKQEAMPAGGGAGPFNYMPGQWKAGDRLPAEYRDRQYAIDDYREYQLPAPKRGHHWVGVGSEFFLVNGNGVIAQVGP